MSIKLPRSNIFAFAVASVAIMSLYYCWQGSTGLSLWDEGYLWYGAQRVVAGEVPIRDFMAYDPGRYYLSAWVMQAMGDDGILNLRLALALIHAAGLALALNSVALSNEWTGLKRHLLLAASAFIFVAWMSPRHKAFDVTASISAVSMLAWAIQRPNGSRYFFLGIGIGLLAINGRNHGVYALAGSTAAIFLLNRDKTIGDTARQLFALAQGIVIGFSPILLMLIFIPGFAPAFIDSVYVLFEQKSTNIALPVPWPWLVDFENSSPAVIANTMTIGLAFVWLPAIGVYGAYRAVRWRHAGTPASAHFIAASLMTLAYTHHAFSRADAAHLAQSIFPAIIATIILATSWRRTAASAGLSVIIFASGIFMHDTIPTSRCRAANSCVEATVLHDRLTIDRNTAVEIDLLQRLRSHYAPNGEPWMAIPFWPGAYALFGDKSPTWEIYALLSRSSEFERKEIARMERRKVAFVLLLDIPLDGRDDLMFKNTHPLTYRHLATRYIEVSGELPPSLRLYLRRETP